VGLNQRTGIEIAGESSGLVPTDAWIAKHRKPALWYQGDTLNMAIGQGETRATPLQMANLMALVANNGVSYVPHLVRSVRSPTGKVEKVTLAQQLHRVPASAHFWSTLKNALVGVIDGGTARSAQIPGLRWGGKTGSAEHGKAKRTHSRFVGIAPADDPKIAICVLAESAGHGGEISAPIARQIVQRYLAESSASSKSRAAASALDASAESPTDR
jgi:penicillin-binding protein 2